MKPFENEILLELIQGGEVIEGLTLEDAKSGEADYTGAGYFLTLYLKSQ